MPLLVCATPIGNLDDVTLRVLAALGDADVVLCEDTRHTPGLLTRHGVSAKALLSYHQHNEAQRVSEIVPRLQTGETVALVSDAGLPGINDPGGRLVAAALDAGVEVAVLPGASAVETALVASGLVGEQYRFIGYLPRRAAEREALWLELRREPHPVVAFESPQRIASSLASLALVCPERPVAVCRELTKRFEEVVRGSAREVVERLGDTVRGEITLVIGPDPAGVVAVRAADGDALAEAVRSVAELCAAGTPRRAAVDVVARLTGVSRRALYDASLD